MMERSDTETLAQTGHQYYIGISRVWIETQSVSICTNASHQGGL